MSEQKTILQDLKQKGIQPKILIGLGFLEQKVYTALVKGFSSAEVNKYHHVRESDVAKIKVAVVAYIEYLDSIKNNYKG